MGRHRVTLLLPPLGAREDGRLAPALDLLDDGLAEVQDLLGRQLLARLDDGAALEDTPVGGHLLAERVDEDIGDADGVPGRGWG